MNGEAKGLQKRADKGKSKHVSSFFCKIALLLHAQVLPLRSKIKNTQHTKICLRNY